MTAKKEKITVLTREEMFAKNCKVFDLRREYPGFDGEIYWAIAAPYTNTELHAFFSDLIAPFEPFVLLSAGEGRAFKDFINNEKKHYWRNKHNNDAFGYVDGEMEFYHPELTTSSVEEDYIRIAKSNALHDLLLNLTEKQRRYIILHYINGYTIREIASKECVNHKTISESIDAGIKKLQKILKNTPPNDLSHWE